MLLSWGLSREPMMLRPQPTMVGWGLSIWGSSELSVGDRVLVGGLRVEVEVLDDERTSTPAVVKDLDNVSPYLLLLCVA